MNRIISALDRLAETKHHLRGSIAFRYIVGTALTYQLAVLAGRHRYFFGADAQADFAGFVAGFGTEHVSFMALSNSVTWQWLGYGLGVVILLLWTIGYGRHVGTFLAWWAVHSLHARAVGIWDGGDNLAEIVLLYAIPIDLWGAQTERRAGAAQQVATTLHNLALMACVLQVCIMYFNAGIAKVPGKYWQNGTAFYYVLASEEFGMTGIGPFIWSRPVLLGLMTWAPLLLQLAFPWIYLFGRPWPRRLTVVGAMAFHLGILTLMGLSSFAVIMIGVEMLLLSDGDWAALRELMTRFKRTLPKPRDAAP
ncbi:MAG: HTTM domain-containing protein [Deltaproteobacteria bacterium]|nr:HTTM domain-containing protein [Deltaproteobacteria bacterium]